MDMIVPLNRLVAEGFGHIVCYPKRDEDELSKRVKEMRRLGVKALNFKGEKHIGSILVLGKGYVGVVVLAQTGTGLAALKIRRTDSGRADMRHEAEMLRFANSVGVGPKLLGFTENLLMTEFVDGALVSTWIESLEKTESVRLKVRNVLREILEQCWKLDEIGVDHGELSWASKHIVVGNDNRVCILDFETASARRKVSNVTSVCHFLFMRGKTADLTYERIGMIDRGVLLEALRSYKETRTREKFEAVLMACLL
jgi:putative serine/threonine protein kinase